MSTVLTPVQPKGAMSWISAERLQRLGWAIVIAGALVRLLFLAIHPAFNYVYSDMEGYVSRAQGVIAGAPLTPYYTLEAPGTHLLLVAPLWLFGSGHGGLVAASWLWWLLSSLIPLATWQLARRLVGSRTAVVAAALAAFDPLLISYGGYLSSEIPVTALMLCSLALAYRARRSGWGLAALALAGLLGGAAVVVRPQVILNFAVFALALRPWLANRRALAAFLCAFALPLGGGIAYSSVARGQLSLASNGGVNFFSAQCEVHSMKLTWEGGAAYEAGSPVAAQLNRGGYYEYIGIAPWDEGFFYREGLHCMARHPLAAVGIALRNVLDLTATSVPWPQSNEVGLGRIADITNILYCGALLAVLCALAWWRWRTRRRLHSGVRTLLWQLFAIVPVAVVFGGDPRYRLPYDAFGLILIATALVAVAGRLEGEDGSPEADEAL